HQRSILPVDRRGHDLFSGLDVPGANSAHPPAATGSESAASADSLHLIRGDLTGPNPTDRAKPGSKLHVLTDRAGIPLAVAVSGANVHDSQALKPLVKAIPAVRSRRGPRRRRPGKLHADKAYDQPELRRWIRERGIGVRIARKGVESSERLGRHRWVVERTISWLTGNRRLAIRYDHKGTHFLGFLTLAAALTGFKKLAKARASM